MTQMQVTEKQAVKEIALACGIKPQTQGDGSMELDPCIYAFADELLSRVRHGQEMMNMCKGAKLSDALYLIHIGERDSNDMEIARALDILRSVRNELVSPPQPHTDTEQIGRMVQLDLPMDMPPVYDPVNHPSHYKMGKVQCIEAIKSSLTEEEFRGYCKGNVIKYTWRERYKAGRESLEKAKWYLTYLLDKV